MQSLVLNPAELRAVRRRRLDWLSRAEHDEFARLARAERRDLWLGGRWLIKSLVQAWRQGTDFAQIHVESRDGRGRPAAPRVYVDGKAHPARLSLSHAAGHVIAAGSTQRGDAVGCDLVELQANPPGFVRFWLSEAERAWVRRCDHVAASNVIWAFKEAIYKSQHGGQPFRPASLDVDRRLAAWGLRLPPPLRQLDEQIQRSPWASYVIRRVGPCLAVVLNVFSRCSSHRQCAAAADSSLPAPSIL